MFNQDYRADLIKDSGFLPSPACGRREQIRVSLMDNPGLYQCSDFSPVYKYGSITMREIICIMLSVNFYSDELRNLLFKETPSSSASPGFSILCAGLSDATISRA